METALFVGAVGFLLFIFGRLAVNEVLLDLHHRVASGVVQRVELGRSVDFARVSFADQAGHRHTSQVQLPWLGGEVEVGDGLAVEYDPSNPGRARRRGAHDPLALVPVAIGIAGVVLVTRVRRG